MEIKIGSSVEIEAHGHLLKGVVKSNDGEEFEAEVSWPKKFAGVPIQFNKGNVIFPNDNDDEEDDDKEKPLPKVILTNKKVTEKERPTDLESKSHQDLAIFMAH